MPKNRLFAEAALIAALLAPAGASAEESADEFSDPDILSAIHTAESDTLDSFLERSSEEAVNAGRNAWALLEAARSEVRAAAPILRRLSEGESADFCAQMIEAKETAFRLKAASSSVDLGTLDAEALHSREASYRRKDRERDLRRGLAALDKAQVRRKPDLSREETLLVAALKDCSAEVRGALALLRSSAAKSQGGEKASLLGAAERVLEHAEGIETEGKLLELQLKLRRIDEDSFDPLKD
jgi:hypothetical protein